MPLKNQGIFIQMGKINITSVLICYYFFTTYLTSENGEKVVTEKSIFT